MKYYTYDGNEEAALRNGSFLRISGSNPSSLVCYLNGDFMGWVGSDIQVDMARYVEVDAKWALTLIPQCCGGKRA